ncbi:Transcriptional regulator, XRE family protein [Desulfamplus magnetovallimortis]|uniref:Transcriptional regulator, XRE family protein n=1 Tax=Desulfamplus magnetovallimortis TaxID=1246637 RepID=A0A1W1HFH6_9BACT|nr:HigA family addiction module antitoxin [Desulfamplus magnetovallimortis]SLM31237.1 Transcriptional regulator, XRE family protein [Desulfamplus magnetovallimortis]
MTTKRKPAHPGRILKNMYLEPLNLTITYVADMLGVSRKAISSIVNERKSVTPEMALRFSIAFDTTPELWMNLQKNHDLWRAANSTEGWKDVKPIYIAPSFA